MSKKSNFKKSHQPGAFGNKNRSKDERIRHTLSEIVEGRSKLLDRPDDLYETLNKSIDDIESLEDPTLQLELLAWVLRCDFVVSEQPEEEAEDWNAIFYDAGTFFIEIAKDFADKNYVADLIHDLTFTYGGEDGRSVIFLSLEEVMPKERGTQLLQEILKDLADNDFDNNEDILSAVCDMADSIHDTETYVKAALCRDPDKDNATLIDIANACFVAGDVAEAKNWLSDVRDPGAEDEEAFLDLNAAIADKEGRKDDCRNFAETLYERYPKVMNLARYCQLVDRSRAEQVAAEHVKFRSGEVLDLELLQYLAMDKHYDLLAAYVGLHEQELPAQDAEVLNAISDALEKDCQPMLAKHIRDWTVEEPEEAEPLDDKD